MKAKLVLSQPLDVLMRQAAGGVLLEDVRKRAREAPTSAKDQAIERLEARQTLAPLAVNARRTKRLKDGTVGWCVRAPRMDDCFAAAIATCLQVPIDQCPDPRLDERLAAGDTADEVDRDAREELAAWLADRDLRLVKHHRVPLAQVRRWIGIVPMPGAFADHCLVLDRGRVIFDPTLEVDARPVRLFGPHHVKFGYSFRAV